MARAAEREHITPSSVSRRITALEAHLGIRLLQRTDRGVRPTAAGIDFHICAQEILSTIERTARKFDTFRNGAAGLVRIHAHTTAINPYLITKLRAFNHAAPNVDVIIEERMSAEIIEDIHSVKADIGIVSGTTYASGLTSHAGVSAERVALQGQGLSGERVEADQNGLVRTGECPGERRAGNEIGGRVQINQLKRECAGARR